MVEYPFEISPMFEGERIRKEGMFVELGGPKSLGLELVRAKPMDEIEDDKVKIIGPDLKYGRGQDLSLGNDLQHRRRTCRN